MPELLRGVADPQRRDAAFGELDNALYHQGGWVCSAASAAVPFLLRLAADPTVAGRFELVGLLGTLAEEARLAEPRFVDAGWPAAWDAGRPQLLALLADPQPEVRMATAVAVAIGAGPGPDTGQVGVVLERLVAAYQEEPLLNARVGLVFAVGDLARQRPAPVPDEVRVRAGAWLRERLGQQPPVALAATVALRWLDPTARLTADQLTPVLAGLGHDDESAWGGVHWVSSDPARRLPHLGVEFLGDLDRQIQLVAGMVGAAGPANRFGAVLFGAGVLRADRSATDRLLPLVAGRLADPDPSVRSVAAHVLAAVGGRGAGYADQVAALLADDAPVGYRTAADDAVVSDDAVFALARLGDPRVVPVLLERLLGGRTGFVAVAVHSEDRSVFTVCTPAVDEVLAMVGAHATVLLPGLRHRLRTARTSRQREAYVRAAAAWGAAAEPLVDDLLELAARGDAWCPVAEAIGRIGPAAHRALPLLERRVAQGPTSADGSPTMDREWTAAVQAAARIGGDPAVLRDWIGTLLTRPNQLTVACRAAGVLGPAGADLADPIRATLERAGAGDRDDWQQLAAATALWRITGESSGLVAVLAPVFAKVTGARPLPVARAAGGVLVELLGSARTLAALTDAEATDLRATCRAVAGAVGCLSTAAGWRGLVHDEAVRATAAALLALVDE